MNKKVIILSSINIEVAFPRWMFSFFISRYAVENSPIFPGVKIPRDHPKNVYLNKFRNLTFLKGESKIFRLSVPTAIRRIKKKMERKANSFICIKEL